MTQSATVHCADGTPIEFEWADGAYPSLSFSLNSEHWTYPATPMERYLDWFNSSGAKRAFHEVDLPGFVHAQFVGPFQYVAMVPPEGEALAAAMRGVGALMGRFGSPLGYWLQFCEVRCRAAAEALSGSLTTAPIAEVEDAYAYGQAQTFTSLLPLVGAFFPLRELLQQRFGPEGSLLADEATQGGTNASQAMDLEIVKLANLVREVPTVARILRGPRNRRLEALRGESSAAPFMERFDALVEEHGDRSFGWELALPTWSEDSDAVLALIAAHLRASGNASVAANSEAIRDAAHRRILAGLEEGERQQFLAFVGLLNGLVQVREDRAYWQMRLVGTARRLLLRKGEALVRDGVIDTAADILFLIPMEFEAANHGDLRHVVTKRKEEWERYKTLTPPAFIGAPPAEAMPESLSARDLRGLPGSRGSATGTARIMTSPDDIDRFEEGDVLVCRITTPAWTPLIGLASALITETGSPMSHPAITAREYGIPCVLSVVDATKFITDGGLVTVDGEKGIVSVDG